MNIENQGAEYYFLLQPKIFMFLMFLQEGIIFRYPFAFGCLTNRSTLSIMLHRIYHGSFRNPNQFVWTNFLEWTIMRLVSKFATKVTFALVSNM